MSNAFLLTVCLSGLTASLVMFDPSPAQSKSKSQSKLGSLSGVIHFDGKAPKRSPVDTSTDPVCATRKQLSDEVIVNGGKLKDVHVRIKNGTAGKHETPTTPLIITQDGCIYEPHVVGAMVGQAVAIQNKDQTMHNVHAYIGKDTWFNRSQPKNAPDIVERETGEAGEVFSLKCNVHPWMSSYVPITDHPFFDVSDKSGAFAIKNLPPGKYVLEAWHPKYGLKSKKVRVTTATTKVSFHYP